MLRIVGNLLLRLGWWWAWQLLDVGRLMLRRDLGIRVLRRGIVTLGGTLGRYRRVRRVGMMLWMLDDTGPRVVS